MLQEGSFESGLGEFTWSSTGGHYQGSEWSRASLIYKLGFIQKAGDCTFPDPPLYQNSSVAALSLASEVCEKLFVFYTNTGPQLAPGN